MQAVLVIPESSVLRNYGDAEGVLTGEIAGVPLLIRVIATAMRAGTDALLVVWPPDVDPSIWNRCAASPLLKGLQIRHILQLLDPCQAAHWAAIAPALQDQFLWLPWNWVTHRRAFTGLEPQSTRPARWDVPALLKKDAVTSYTGYPIALSAVEGVLLTPQTSPAAAERFLVAHSGKPTDGIYSRSNRLLCRPAVRLLAHTPVTPNWVTLGGFVVAIVAALMYARGFYGGYVTGALLFFFSGLFDEADGMLARIKFRESVFGTWFEGFVDEATYLLLFAA